MSIFTAEERKKILARKPTTDLQKLAQKENFALFQLASMKANMHSLYLCETVAPYASVGILARELERLTNVIKLAQNKRKHERKKK